MRSIRPEDIIGGECVVVLEAAEDARGTEKNKVVKVKPPRTNKPAATRGGPRSSLQAHPPLKT